MSFEPDEYFQGQVAELLSCESLDEFEKELREDLETHLEQCYDIIHFAGVADASCLRKCAILLLKYLRSCDGGPRLIMLLDILLLTSVNAPDPVIDLNDLDTIETSVIEELRRRKDSAENHLDFSELIVAYFKLMAMASYKMHNSLHGMENRIQVTYKCMRKLMAFAKTGRVLGTTLQWTFLAALNIIKDGCPHADIFQKDSLLILSDMALNNQAIYDNLLRWNSCDWAYKGDCIGLARTENSSTILFDLKAEKLAKNSKVPLTKRQTYFQPLNNYKRERTRKAFKSAVGKMRAANLLNKRKHVTVASTLKAMKGKGGFAGLVGEAHMRKETGDAVDLLSVAQAQRGALSGHQPHLKQRSEGKRDADTSTVALTPNNGNKRGATVSVAKLSPVNPRRGSAPAAAEGTREEPVPLAGSGAVSSSGTNIHESSLPKSSLRGAVTAVLAFFGMDKGRAQHEVAPHPKFAGTSLEVARENDAWDIDKEKHGNTAREEEEGGEEDLLRGKEWRLAAPARRLEGSEMEGLGQLSLSPPSPRPPYEDTAHTTNDSEPDPASRKPPVAAVESEKEGDVGSKQGGRAKSPKSPKSSKSPSHKVVARSGMMRQSAESATPVKPPRLTRVKADTGAIAREKALERSLKRKISREESKLRQEALIEHDREKRRLSEKIRHLEQSLAGSEEDKWHIEQELHKLATLKAEQKDKEEEQEDNYPSDVGVPKERLEHISKEDSSAPVTNLARTEWIAAEGGKSTTSASEGDSEAVVSRRIRKVSSKKRRSSNRKRGTGSRKVSDSASDSASPHRDSLPPLRLHGSVVTKLDEGTDGGDADIIVTSSMATDHYAASSTASTTKEEDKSSRPSTITTNTTGAANADSRATTADPEASFAVTKEGGIGGDVTTDATDSESAVVHIRRGKTKVRKRRQARGSKKRRRSRYDSVINKKPVEEEEGGEGKEEEEEEEEEEEKEEEASDAQLLLPQHEKQEKQSGHRVTLVTQEHFPMSPSLIVRSSSGEIKEEEEEEDEEEVSGAEADGLVDPSDISASELEGGARKHRKSKRKRRKKRRNTSRRAGRPTTVESAAGLPAEFEAVGLELSQVMANPALPRETVTFRSSGTIAKPPAALVALNSGRLSGRSVSPRQSHREISARRASSLAGGEAVGLDGDPGTVDVAPGMLLDGAMRAASRERSERTTRIMASKPIIQNMSARERLGARSTTPDGRASSSSQSHREREHTPNSDAAQDKGDLDVGVLSLKQAPLTDPTKLRPPSTEKGRSGATMDALSPYIRGNTTFIRRPSSTGKAVPKEAFSLSPRSPTLPRLSPAGGRPGSSSSGRGLVATPDPFEATSTSESVLMS